MGNDDEIYRKQLEEKTRKAEIIIENHLPEAKGSQARIIEAMRYAVTAGGKRLRPLLMGEVYDMFGGKGEIVFPFMAAVEMIHTYSLVHDDLPAMDDDMYRRGKLTTHAVYGEALGILAGDALLNYAFETMSSAFSLYPDDAVKIGAAINIISRKAGIYGMIGGQAVDVMNTGEELTKTQVDFIHEHKTAALIEASMMTGAVLAGASGEDVGKVESAAEKIGIAFQIRDDILDVTASTETLGKPAGSDMKNGKTTYATLFGADAAENYVTQLTNEAKETLSGLGRECGFLKWLTESLVTRSR